MRAITCLIVGGFPREAEWLKVTLPAFWRHYGGELLVVDNSTSYEGWITTRAVLDDSRAFLAVNPELGRPPYGDLAANPDWPRLVKEPGTGYDTAIAWCRRWGYDALWSFEADCLAAGPWQRELLDAVEAGAWMAGGCRIGYGPLHHVPACYATGVDWPTFAARPKGADREHPRYAELYDDAAAWACGIACGGEEHSRWFRDTWDVGQAAWFWAACQDRAKYVPIEDRRFRHFWGGSRRPVPEELANAS